MDFHMKHFRGCISLSPPRRESYWLQYPRRHIDPYLLELGHHSSTTQQGDTHDFCPLLPLLPTSEPGASKRLLHPRVTHVMIADILLRPLSCPFSCFIRTIRRMVLVTGFACSPMSFGLTMEGCHSSEERLKNKTVNGFWNLVVAILEVLAKPGIH